MEFFNPPPSRTESTGLKNVKNKQQWFKNTTPARFMQIKKTHETISRSLSFVTIGIKLFFKTTPKQLKHLVVNSDRKKQ